MLIYKLYDKDIYLFFNRQDISVIINKRLMLIIFYERPVNSKTLYNVVCHKTFLHAFWESIIITLGIIALQTL